jgi:DNA-binding NarL/FixJ family response regulator
MDSPLTRVAIIDDNTKFRKQLVKLLEKQPDLYVVSAVDSGLDGIKQLEEQKPDVILIDSNSPFTEDLDSTSMIVSRFPDTRIIVLSMKSPPSTTASFCEAYACYSRCENCTDMDILAAIRGDQ